MKDATRQRCYRAEQAVRSSLAGGKKGKKGNAAGDITFKGDDAAREALDTIVVPALTSLDHCPDTTVTKVFVKPGKGSSWYRRFGNAGAPEIELKEGWGESLLVLTHEYTHHLAHNVTPLYTSDALPSHGGEWARLFLDAVDLVYCSLDRPDVPALLREQFEKQRATVQPFDQAAKARKQILRLRSDVLLANPKARLAPVADVVYAECRGDFTGSSYKRTHEGKYNVRGLDGDFLTIDNGGDPVAIPWEQLRYVAGPMIRHR